MPNRDYDRDYERRDPRSRRYDDVEDAPEERSFREPIDRGYPSRRPYSDRGQVEEYARRPRRNEPTFDDYTSGNVTITTPKSFFDVQALIDHLRRGESIIVSLEGLEEESAQRILDFLSGAAYGLGGSMCRVKEMHTTFLVTPQGMGIKDTDGDRNPR